MQLELLWSSVSLVFHFIALTLLSGAAVGGAVVDVMFWRRLRAAPGEAAALTSFMVALSTVAPLGAGLALLSGLSLLAAGHFVFWGMMWLDIKLILFVLLVLNGALVAGPSSRRLHALMPAWLTSQGLAATTWSASAVPNAPPNLPKNRAELDAELVRLRKRTRQFHIYENIGFVLILVAAVIKFA
jgi:hypothetical protein